MLVSKCQLGLSNMYKTFKDDVEKQNMIIDSISETMILKMVHLKWFLDVQFLFFTKSGIFVSCSIMEIV